MKNMFSILCFLFTLGLASEAGAQNVSWREYVEQLAEEEEMKPPLRTCIRNCFSSKIILLI